MMPRFTSLLILGAALLGMAGGGAAAPQDVPALPATAWKASAQPGDRVALGESGGALRLAYDVDVRQAQSVYGKTLHRATFRVELNEPVAVAPDAMRLVFEARGQDGSAEARTGTVFVRPLLADENGEEFAYEPYPVDALKAGKSGDWARWTTRPFLVTEAGGATPQVYTARGGDLNAWPDGKLRFVGFEVSVQKDAATGATGRRSGEIFLGPISLARLAMPETGAEAFADAFLQEKGTYRVAMEVSPAFQALPVAEAAQTIAFDPADEASRRQVVRAPLDGLRNAWVRYAVTDARGKSVAGGTLRREQDIAPQEQKIPPAVDPASPPSVGAVRFNPDRPEGGVYGPKEPVEITARVFGKAPATLRWSLSPYTFPQVVQKGETALPSSPSPFRDVTIAPTLPPGQNAFRLRYSLWDSHGGQIDEGEYVVGIADDPAPALATRQGVLPDRNEIKTRPYFRVTYQARRVGLPPDDSADKAAERFSGFLDEAAQMTNHVTYMVDLAEFEVLPHVYDFALLDKLMDAAADHGCHVTIRLGHGEAAAPFLWQPYTKPRDFDGSAIAGHPAYKAFAVADPVYVDAWLRAFRALHDRYAAHPGFEGYYVLQPGGEWVIPDEIWFGMIADYSWASAAAFRDYLRKEGGFSLKQLAARWGVPLASWDDVRPPPPDLAIGARPDLRSQWIDFCRFKLWLSDSWNTRVAGYIRTFDPTHVVIVYGRWTDGAFNKDLPAVADYVHNGGNHVLEGEGMLTGAWAKGLGLITEPHDPHSWADYGDPAGRGWVLDWSVFVMMSQAGGGGANLHVYYFPDPDYSLADHYGGVHVYDRYEKFKPILRELHGLEIAAPPKQAAVVQDADTLLTKHRTTFLPRIGDLSRWFDLLKGDSIGYEPFAPEHARQYKLLVVNPLDQVMGGESIDEIGRAVRSGAWLVTSACAGRYSPDRPGEAYPLLKSLGIPPPPGAFERGEPRVEARTTPQGAALLGKASLPFYSQADMRRDLDDPALAAKFTQWPYRYIPQTDYFGYYRANAGVGGEVVATFPDGGVAVSSHRVGQGRVVVFWGTPSLEPEKMQGVLGRIAQAAGVVDPRAGSPIPHVLEGDNKALKRHYALLYQEAAGSYVQKLPATPDGTWFVDDMVSDERLGTYSGKALREQGVRVAFDPGHSPLKVVRMIPLDSFQAPWKDKYPSTP